jgi:hypothetical protein
LSKKFGTQVIVFDSPGFAARLEIAVASGGCKIEFDDYMLKVGIRLDWEALKEFEKNVPCSAGSLNFDFAGRDLQQKVVV